MVKDNDGISMLAGMVVSMVKGRIRCRSPYLRKPETARFLEKFAAALPGMREVTVNTTVGSVLFVYDPELLDPQRIAAAYAEFLPPLPVRERPGKTCRVLKAAAARCLAHPELTLSLLGAVGSGYLLPRLHPLCGWLLLGGSLLHCLRAKKSGKG
ncbi:MAG: hypothetical protein LBR82_07905 [Desulfovibrio sp.]|jgi:hypothetical protein|nr:hypothetical protein [Desulfovibrio sp.]